MTSKVEAPKDYKALTKKYFTKLENDVYKCHCGKLLKRKDGTGWSNLMQHIRSQHGNDNTSISDQQTLRFMHCRKSETVYGWLEWVCMELKPFSFVESSLTRKYSSLDKISVHTLEKYMHLVSDRVEKEIAKELPDIFALIVDGWTEASSHFVGVMASYPGKHEGYETALLAPREMLVSKNSASFWSP